MIIIIMMFFFFDFADFSILKIAFSVAFFFSFFSLVHNVHISQVVHKSFGV